MNNEIVFDIETDGLHPSKIHCMAYLEDCTNSYKEMRNILSQDITLVGHNIILYDIPVLEKLLGVVIKCRLIDTLALSWYLYSERPLHGLDSWGKTFGIEKPKVDDWENLTQEEYNHRCKEDVRINTTLWSQIKKDLIKLYGSWEKALEFINYLMFKMDCIREQHKSMWRLDTDKLDEYITKLQEEYAIQIDGLKEAMPKRPVYTTKTKPLKMFKKNGELSVAGVEWKDLLAKLGKLENTLEVTYVKDYEEPNPSSPIQVKNWLYSLGWVPKTFKYTRNSEGDLKKIPQVNIQTDEGASLCSSITTMIDEHEGLKYLEGVSVTKHRLDLLTSFKDNSVDGYIIADVGGLTNTLRFKHRVLVNLPSIAKKYGDWVRGVLVAPYGFELCGSDMSSLEDRTKQHYMWDYDPDYVSEMLRDDFDPHLDLAVFAGAVSKEDVDKFKAGDPKLKKIVSTIRRNYKTANYACVYGASGGTVARSAGLSEHEGVALVESYWRRNWAVKKIAEDCITKTCNGKKWLYNPVSNFWYELRADKDRFSTLNQSTGVYCFDMWVKEIRKKRPQLTAQFHDEIILCIKKGARDKCKKLLRESLDKVNDKLRLNRPLDIDIQFGNNYSEIH